MMKNSQTIAFLLFAFAIETAYSAEAYTHSYKNPSDCTTDCAYSVMISTDGTQATIKLSTNAGGMVALGFSSDEMMGSDDVAGCYNDGSGNAVVVDAWNPSRTPSPHTANKKDAINNLVEANSTGEITNGVLSCTLVRNLKTNDTAEDVDWNDPWYLLYAWSSTPGPGAGGSLSQHLSTTRKPSMAKISIAIASTDPPTTNTTAAPPTPTPADTATSATTTEGSTATDAGTALAFAKAYGILLLLAWLGYWCH